MTISIAHLGPVGTNTETAGLAYVKELGKIGADALLCPYPSIAQSLLAVARGEVDLAVVPVENSIEGSVTITLDMLWQLDHLRIKQALVLPITHALISCAKDLKQIKTICSHPQALGQCQAWIEEYLPNVQLIPANATTEALQNLADDHHMGAIASPRAAELYQLPILHHPINDHPENYTRFWVLQTDDQHDYDHYLEKLSKNAESSIYTSLAFSVPANLPGSLVNPLQVFARRHINLTRIESRPTKKLLGDYVFFIDIA
ncbi:MAG: prephenate dehydratase, partial [Microcoleaceae cyanobacterium]